MPNKYIHLSFTLRQFNGGSINECIFTLVLFTSFFSTFFWIVYFRWWLFTSDFICLTYIYVGLQLNKVCYAISKLSHPKQGLSKNGLFAFYCFSHWFCSMHCYTRSAQAEYKNGKRVFWNCSRGKRGYIEKRF